MKQDTLKYLTEIYFRIIKLENMLDKDISDVQRRDIIVRRNELLNEAIRVLETELKITAVEPVRFLKLNIRKEIAILKVVILKIKAAQEGKANAKIS